MIDFTDPMSQFHGRKTSKIIKPGEITKSEWSEQLTFCKWLKHQHPNIRFRSDMQSAGKLSPQMQNIKLIIDPWRAWPDIQVYHKSGNFCGLMIEMKRVNSGTFLKDGSLSSGKHVQEQNEMNEFLRGIGWRVEFSEGFEEAKRIFEEYVNK